jgi:hypothetical protein
VQLVRGTKRAKVGKGDRSLETKKDEDSDEEESGRSGGESDEEERGSGEEEEEGATTTEHDPMEVATNLFGPMVGKGSVRGAQFRSPRSHERTREAQVAKHFTTLLRTAGEHHAQANKKKADVADPVEVQSSYIGGNLYFSTNSTVASKNLVDLVKKGGGTRKVLEETKPPVKAVRKPAHARIQSKVKKLFAGTRDIVGEDPVDVQRAKQTAEIMKTTGELSFLDPAHEDFEEHLKAAKRTRGKAYVVPGEKHAELNVAEFRDEHLADVDDPLAKTYGSKRNCATCHGEMTAQHTAMASGQGPGLLVKNQIPVISAEGRKATYEQMRDFPTNVTLLQHGKMDTGTASDSDTDTEGEPMKNIPAREPKVPAKVTGSKRKRK